jgi:hypothetical protein
MTIEEFATDLFKALAIGGVSFACSLIYINYRLDPSRNVSLVPVGVKIPSADVDVCTINRNKLTLFLAKAERIKMNNTPGTDENYLSKVITDNSDTILSDLVKPATMKALKEEEVTSTDDCNQKELPFIEAAAILKEGSQYMLYRDCNLQVKGLAQTFVVRADPSAKEENETLLLEKTSTMKFEILKVSNDRNHLATLVSTLKNAVVQRPNTIQMKLTCKFISPDDVGRESRDVTYGAEVEKLSLPKSFPGDSLYFPSLVGQSPFSRR